MCYGSEGVLLRVFGSNHVPQRSCGVGCQIIGMRLVFLKWLILASHEWCFGSAARVDRIEQEDVLSLAGAERKEFPIIMEDPFNGEMGVTYPEPTHQGFLESAFFATKGSVVRTMGDKIMPWYLKWWGTPGQRSEYLLAKAYRWVCEHPGATAVAAAAATGGLIYYWYRSRRISTEDTVKNAMLNITNSTPEEMNKTAPVVQKLVAFHELQAARTVVLEAAAEGECILTKIDSNKTLKKKKLTWLLKKKSQAENGKLAPLSATCNGITKKLHWNGPVKELCTAIALILQLKVLEIFA